MFHLVHDIVKSYALAIGRQLRQARQALQHAEDRLQRSQEREPRHSVTREATRQERSPKQKCGAGKRSSRRIGSDLSPSR